MTMIRLEARTYYGCPGKKPASLCTGAHRALLGMPMHNRRPAAVLAPMLRSEDSTENILLTK